VAQAADVVEEVARIVGYETLPETLPLGRATPVQRDPIYLLQGSARRTLVAAGCAEAVTYVTLPDDLVRLFAAEDGRAGFLHEVATDRLIRLRNPLQSERAVLRPTLVPNLLEAASANLKHERSVRLFELARVYLPSEAELPREANVAGLVLAGQREEIGRFAAGGELDFFDLKGTVEALVARLGIPEATFERASHPALHPGRTARLHAGGATLGLLGELRPDRAAAFGLDEVRVSVAELDLDALLAARPGAAEGVTVPRFLPVEQDFAVVVAEETPAGEVERALLAGAGALATGIALFDVYRGPQVGADRKSLAYRVTFTAPDRALTDAELTTVRERIGRTLAQRVGGELRG
jgi:phenylalanyl-tRNA synthetase beta chain